MSDDDVEVKDEEEEEEEKHDDDKKYTFFARDFLKSVEVTLNLWLFPPLNELCVEYANDEDYWESRWDSEHENYIGFSCDHVWLDALLTIPFKSICKRRDLETIPIQQCPAIYIVQDSKFHWLVDLVLQSTADVNRIETIYYFSSSFSEKLHLRCNPNDLDGLKRYSAIVTRHPCIYLKMSDHALRNVNVKRYMSNHMVCKFSFHLTKDSRCDYEHKGHFWCGIPIQGDNLNYCCSCHITSLGPKNPQYYVESFGGEYG